MQHVRPPCTRPYSMCTVRSNCTLYGCNYTCNVITLYLHCNYNPCFPSTRNSEAIALSRAQQGRQLLYEERPAAAAMQRRVCVCVCVCHMQRQREVTAPRARWWTEVESRLNVQALTNTFPFSEVLSGQDFRIRKEGSLALSRPMSAKWSAVNDYCTGTVRGGLRRHYIFVDRWTFWLSGRPSLPCV